MWGFNGASATTRQPGAAMDAWKEICSYRVGTASQPHPPAVGGRHPRQPYLCLPRARRMAGSCGAGAVVVISGVFSTPVALYQIVGTHHLLLRSRLAQPRTLRAHSGPRLVSGLECGQLVQCDAGA